MPLKYVRNKISIALRPNGLRGSRGPSCAKAPAGTAVVRCRVRRNFNVGGGLMHSFCVLKKAISGMSSLFELLHAYAAVSPTVAVRRRRTPPSFPRFCDNKIVGVY